MAWLSRWVVAAVLIWSAGASAADASFGASQQRQSPTWDHPWTVVTMAPDGSWGVATEAYIYQAVAKAVSNCRRMSRHTIGCGAQFTVIRSGWTIALRCGKASIIVAEQNIASAERAAADREMVLRLAQAERPPPCSRVLTVDPYGSVVRTPPAIDRPDVAASAPD